MKNIEPESVYWYKKSHEENKVTKCGNILFLLMWWSRNRHYKSYKLVLSFREQIFIEILEPGAFLSNQRTSFISNNVHKNSCSKGSSEEKEQSKFQNCAREQVDRK